MECVFHINLVFAGSRHIYVPLWVLMEGWKIHNAGWSSSLGRHAVRVQWQVAIRGRCICWVIKGLFIWSRSVPWARYLEIFCKILMFSYCRPGLLGFSKRSLGNLGEILAIWTLQPSHQDCCHKCEVYNLWFAGFAFLLKFRNRTRPQHSTAIYHLGNRAEISHVDPELVPVTGPALSTGLIRRGPNWPLRIGYKFVSSRNLPQRLEGLRDEPCFSI